MAKVKQPLKWHGGKFYLSSWIHSLAPAHTHRVYLYAGGLGEAWNWPHEGVSEVANDVNRYLTNFYKVLQDPKLFARLKRRLDATPFSREEWNTAHTFMSEYTRHPGNDVELALGVAPSVDVAALFFVWNRQSMAGRMKSFSPLTRTRTRGGRNAEANSWRAAVDGLPEVLRRLDNMVVECDDALAVLAREDTPGTLFYADPPYLVSDAPGEGRTSKAAYHHEAGREHHELLLRRLTASPPRGKVMLSGYPSAMYDKYLTRKAGWVRHERKIDNKAQKAAPGGPKRVMTECLWVYSGNK